MLTPLEDNMEQTQQSVRSWWFRRWLCKLQDVWKSTQVSHRGAYTSRRARALERYCHTASLTRVFTVCVLTPVPVLGFVVAIELLPLSPPSDGWRGNSAWVLRYVFVFVLLTLSCLQQASGFLTSLNVTLGQALAITWICVSCYFIVLLAIMAVWVFPVPFVFELTGGVYSVIFVVCIVVVFGGQTLVKTPKLSTQMRVLYKVSMLEGSMCFVYPAFSAAFRALDGGWQLAFFVVLYGMKVLMRVSAASVYCSATKDEEDRAKLRSRLPEFVVFTTDLFHLVYLMTCLQGPQISVWTAAILVVADILTSGFRVYRLLHRPLMVLILGPPERRRSSTRRSLSAVMPIPDPPISTVKEIPSTYDSVSRVASRIIARASSLKLAQRSLSRSRVSHTSKSSRRSLSRSHPAIVLSQNGDHNEKKRSETFPTQETSDDFTRFQTLSMIEYFILVEYVSCAIPLMIGVYTTVLAHLPNAVYYPSLANITPRHLHEIQVNVAVYVVLQLLSMLVLSEVLRRRLQFSVMHQLAFVLETAAADIQAKFAMFIPYCFFFFLEHNGTSLNSTELLLLLTYHTMYVRYFKGVDFTFRFAWMH
ncbi:hypothetical protein P3T76_014464 [Phytophthora citrophthora]|uniref:Transmembrane protein n=1 Tax=Phytophthora citrophthora TaxID=4793 RepID=A0AAD9G1X4_9STRA|nr:hypothetical protein P3T76_014464 [Phytophthora citrophthora]